MQIIADDKLFGNLLPFIHNIDVTDINWNGRQLWINDLNNGRYLADVVLDDEFVNSFARRIADIERANFNQYEPILEAETDELRIVCIHEAAATSGTVISIRKTPASMRISDTNMITTGYADTKTIKFLKHCVEDYQNIMVCGLPGEGKTELLKYLTNFINPYDRTITIEDSSEIHYTKLHTNKDGVEIKVNEYTSYDEAIKASLRLLPVWLLLSEARDIEAKSLIKGMLTGTHNISTLHASDAREIPMRLLDMFPPGEDDTVTLRKICTQVNVGIRVKAKIDKQITREITQIALYDYDYKANEEIIVVVFEDGKWADQKSWPKKYKHLMKRMNDDYENKTD